MPHLSELLEHFNTHHFYESVSGRTVFNILFKNMHIIYHTPFGMVRKPCTIFRPDWIDGAFVVLKVQKLTWLLFVDPVIVFILV